MEYLGGLRVIPTLPENLERLKDLTYNLYFAWHPEVRDLFIEIDRGLWKKTNHNPVKFLNEVAQKKLESIAISKTYLDQYNLVIQDFDRYLKEKNTWFTKNFSEFKDINIAYFTAEFGFHESLPIYAGGLGVLAGDHMKSASDLGIPITGVGLFYHQTYFTQEIDGQGQQISHYQYLNPVELPLTLVEKSPGSPLLIQVPLAGRNVYVKIWKALVGKVTVYLLDTNVANNSKADKEITSRLYGGDQEMRIAQEIILGMGGVLALHALNIHPNAWHMNEGHSVFLVLQRVKELIQNNKLSFSEALEAVSANTIFTTHTPVPAGNDAFPLHIKDKYFQKYWESVGIHRHQFMELGSQIQPEGYEIFNLTILALNLSRFRNGVSKLHGEVSRNLWKTVWPDFPSSEIPIDHITNGVHLPSWTARKTRVLYEKTFGKDWLKHHDDPQRWEKIKEMKDEDVWKLKLELKQKMLNHVRERLTIQFERNRMGSLHMVRVRKYMKPDILTIGFARRFATYKRGTLIFRNPDRLKHLINDPMRPIQLIFAGKAHPKDGGGQDLIRQIHQFSLLPELRGKIVFVENYDMGLARDLVSGVDVWLNNPRRTQEASGTSGQKGAMNGTLNFSVLDGWWTEGFNNHNGWAFGDKEHTSLDDWDSWDNEELYDILENDIIPLYYDRNEKNLPVKWISRMKNAMYTISPQFNTHRMVKEYVKKMYIPAYRLGTKYHENNFQVSKDYASWKDNIELHWSDVTINPVHQNSPENGSVILNFGEDWKIEALVKLGPISPENVKVQIYLEKDRQDVKSGHEYEIFDMELTDSHIKKGYYKYQALIKPSDSGHYLYTLRVIPHHPFLANPVELGTAEWYQR